jgi:hypothetical protein
MHSKDSSGSHHWKFFRTGGLDQVALETGADLLSLEHLDQKLWVALSCPTTGLEFDTQTLQLIDTDKDGRIRAPELIAAIRWAAQHLKDVDTLVSGAKRLPLSAIQDNTPDGRLLLSSARQILRVLGKADETSIGVEDTSDKNRIFAQARLNGDGVVTPATATDEKVAALIQQIIDTLGSVPDRSGKPGIDSARLNDFFKQLKDYSDWWAIGEQNNIHDKNVFPVGDKTPVSYDIFSSLRDKIDDFFNRVRLSSFDERSASFLNRPDQHYADWAGLNLANLPAEVQELPIARIAANSNLPLRNGINPAWASRVESFRKEIVIPLLGRDADELSAEEWEQIKNRFASFSAWRTAKKGGAVENLGINRIRELLSSNLKEAIEALIAEDLSLQGEVAAIDKLNRLVRYHRDLHRLANNFVSFTDFFSKDRWAIFQSGTLFLDGRACSLCIKVGDPNTHALMAQLSKCYIAYCECRRIGEEPIKIAAIFSDGDSDNLMVGRNGIFYDRNGRDWDATIVKLLENPISVRQAFWLPYKKFVRMIDEQIAKRAAAADEAANQKLLSAAEIAANADKSDVANAAPAPQAKKIDVGTVAALGVAMGSIGTFLTAIFAYTLGLGYWIPVALLGLMLAISGPSVLLAWIKLRQRTLGAILDANGWAINGRILINLPLARSLTDIRALPENSTRSLTDPFLDKAAIRRRKAFIAILIIGVIAVAGYYGWKIYERSQEQDDATVTVTVTTETIQETTTNTQATPGSPNP